MALLPLFPLGTVLMPGAQLPLQIFEPRYLQLLRDLIDGQEHQTPVFGVIAIREGHEVGDARVKALHPVGCAAQLTHAAPLGDNRFLVVSRGISRFRLHHIDAGAGEPYLTAEISWLSEPEGDPAAVADLATRLREEVAAYRRDVGADPLAPPVESWDLSYWTPAAVTLDLGDRQLLLASSDTESRLRLALQIVRRERAVVASLGAVARLPDPPVNLN
jgi:Lon protease-like protein